MFRRFADIFKKKKKRGKGDVDSLVNLPLEKQTWFHGKITADFAERYLRRDGHFLVREDPAKPGSCFIVVRHKSSPIHVPLHKINASKGTRIKFRVENSNDSFNSIAELIHYYEAERKPLSQKTSAIITHAISRDATLLSTDDFKNRYVTNTGPANATGPLQQKKLDKFARKNSDPGLHLIIANGGKQELGDVDSDNLKWTIQPKQREKIPQVFLGNEDNNSSRLYESPKEGNQADTTVEPEEDLYHVYEKPDQTLNAVYDKPNEPAENLLQNKDEEELGDDESYYDKPTQTENGGTCSSESYTEQQECQPVYDRPPSTGSLGSKSKGSLAESQENLYDKPRASMERASLECSYNSPKGSKDNEDDNSAGETKTPTARPPLSSRPSAPSSSPSLVAESGPLRSPPKKPNRPSLSRRSQSEQTSPVSPETYDSPRTKSVSSDKLDEEAKVDATPAEQEATKSLDKKGIFLNVMKKINEKLLAPFLKADCLSLARHMTHVDLVLLWGEEPHRHSWSFEDGTGGAKGLEILTLPQGREKRAELLER